MIKVTSKILFLKVLFFIVILNGCQSREELIEFKPPIITLDAIWIDGVEFVPIDTIELEKASEVRMKYSINAFTDLVSVNDYYVYGTSGSLINKVTEFSASGMYQGELTGDNFMPFRCQFRVVAFDKYGGASSAGFYLKLPANGLQDIAGGTPAMSQQDKKFGPGQKKYFWSGRFGGRYDNKDVAPNLARLSSIDFGYNFINGKHYLLSISEWERLNPDLPINYQGGTNQADLPVTKFIKLSRFTSSMWNDMSTNERFEYLARSIQPTETSIEIDGVGEYYFFKNGLGYVGIIQIKALNVGNVGKEELQVVVKSYKYW